MYDYDDDYDIYEEEIFWVEEPPAKRMPLLPLIGFAALGVILVLSWLGVTRPASAADSVKAGGVPTPGTVIAPLFTPEVQYWAPKIAAWSQQTGLDPNLIATVMQIESCGDPQATSSAGAMGLFQVMPFHFESGENPYDPAVNARRGLDYLRRALEARGGDPRLGMAGYNGGISGAQRPESQWAAETQRYVYWGVGIYLDARAGKERSPRLEEWLSHGGNSLCAQAAQNLGLKAAGE